MRRFVMPAAWALMVVSALPSWASTASSDVQAQASLVALSDGVSHADPSVRHQAGLLLARDKSAHGIVLLYLLAHDSDANVQQSALASTLNRCNQETPLICAGMMRFFVGDTDALDADAETRWEARDWLLGDDPQAATQAATLTYKLDVVARMGERAELPKLGPGAVRVLRLLAEDPEPEVQEAAAAMLLREKL